MDDGLKEVHIQSRYLVQLAQRRRYSFQPAMSNELPHYCAVLRFDQGLPICVVRSLWRHRASLIQMAAEHVSHMQKANSYLGGVRIAN